jgi:glycosyltransferase involved in cell wall biosynthesis
MKQHVTWAIPGDIETATGGYAYDRRIIAELKELGWEVELLSLGDGFPQPNPAQKAAAEARLRASPSAQPIVIDGLAFGALPEVAAELHRTRPVVAMVHHPLSLETGLSEQQSQALLASERAALASTRSVVTTSPWTADLLVERFGVARDRLSVILPGTDHFLEALGTLGPPLHLLSVGAIVPRKGFDVLIEALAKLADLSWRLTIVGDRTRDPATASRLDDLIARHHLESRIELLGEVSPERLPLIYATADMFVLASRFEGYGMAFAEAMAHALPIVGTTGGAIPKTVPASAGLLVKPGDVAAFADALRAVLQDEKRRSALSKGAYAAAAQLPKWPDSGKKFSELLAHLA